MQLPYSEHQTTSSIEDSINTVLTGPQNEIELAVSESFDTAQEIFDGKANFEIWDEYSEFFGNTASQISSIVGQPVFQGRLPEAFEWADILGIEPAFNDLMVWKKDDKNIYLQLIWEDKDCPIVISLGAS